MKSSLTSVVLSTLSYFLKGKALCVSRTRKSLILMVPWYHTAGPGSRVHLEPLLKKSEKRFLHVLLDGKVQEKFFIFLRRRQSKWN